MDINGLITEPLKQNRFIKRAFPFMTFADATGVSEDDSSCTTIGGRGASGVLMTVVSDTMLSERITELAAVQSNGFFRPVGR